MFNTYQRKFGTDEVLGGLLLIAAIAWSAATLDITPVQTPAPVFAQSAELA
jgi:hypothetical protein